MDEYQGPLPEGDQSQGDGTAAVLYAIFTSFTEALADLERRLDAIESALRSGPADVVTRLDAIEAGLRQAPSGGGSATDVGDAMAKLNGLVQRQSDLVDQRTSALAEALEVVKGLVEAHIDDTAHSISRRAGDAGRRLANDLGLLNRPRRSPER